MIINRYVEPLNNKIEVIETDDGTYIAYYDSEQLGAMYAMLEVAEFYNVPPTDLIVTVPPFDLGWGPAQVLRAK